MEDMLCLALRFLGLMSTFNGQHLNTAVCEEGPHSTRLSSDIPGYHEEHTSANSIDERGQKSGVLKSVVSIGDVNLSPARVGLYPFLALPTSL